MPCTATLEQCGAWHLGLEASRNILQPQIEFTVLKQIGLEFASMSYLMSVVLHVLSDAASYTSPGGAESHELLGVVASGDGARQAEDCG